ncbi:MAG: hypothetical protein AB7J28_01960 [Hyphomonadaceae bacterium]
MPHAANGAARRELRGARASLENARDHAMSALDEVKDDLREASRKATHALKAGLDVGEERLRHAVDSTSDRIDDAHRALSTRIRQRPLMYAGGAIGAGLLIGLLLGARR